VFNKINIDSDAREITRPQQFPDKSYMIFNSCNSPTFGLARWLDGTTLKNDLFFNIFLNSPKQIRWWCKEGDSRIGTWGATRSLTRRIRGN